MTGNRSNSLYRDFVQLCINYYLSFFINYHTIYDFLYFSNHLKNTNKIYQTIYQTNTNTNSLIDDFSVIGSITQTNKENYTE